MALTWDDAQKLALEKGEGHPLRVLFEGIAKLDDSEKARAKELLGPLLEEAQLIAIDNRAHLLAVFKDQRRQIEFIGNILDRNRKAIKDALNSDTPFEFRNKKYIFPIRVDGYEELQNSVESLLVELRKQPFSSEEVISFLSAWSSVKTFWSEKRLKGMNVLSTWMQPYLSSGEDTSTLSSISPTPPGGTVIMDEPPVVPDASVPEGPSRVEAEKVVSSPGVEAPVVIDRKPLESFNYFIGGRKFFIVKVNPAQGLPGLLNRLKESGAKYDPEEIRAVIAGVRSLDLTEDKNKELILRKLDEIETVLRDKEDKERQERERLGRAETLYLDQSPLIPESPVSPEPVTPAPVSSETTTTDSSQTSSEPPSTPESPVTSQTKLTLAPTLDVETNSSEPPTAPEPEPTSTAVSPQQAPQTPTFNEPELTSASASAETTATHSSGASPDSATTPESEPETEELVQGGNTLSEALSTPEPPTAPEPVAPAPVSDGKVTTTDSSGPSSGPTTTPGLAPETQESVQGETSFDEDPVAPESASTSGSAQRNEPKDEANSAAADEAVDGDGSAPEVPQPSAQATQTPSLTPSSSFPPKAQPQLLFGGSTPSVSNSSPSRPSMQPFLLPPNDKPQAPLLFDSSNARPKKVNPVTPSSIPTGNNSQTAILGEAITQEIPVPTPVQTHADVSSEPTAPAEPDLSTVDGNSGLVNSAVEPEKPEPPQAERVATDDSHSVQPKDTATETSAEPESLSLELASPEQPAPAVELATERKVEKTPEQLWEDMKVNLRAFKNGTATQKEAYQKYVEALKNYTEKDAWNYLDDQDKALLFEIKAVNKEKVQEFLVELGEFKEEQEPEADKPEQIPPFPSKGPTQELPPEETAPTADSGDPEAPESTELTAISLEIPSAEPGSAPVQVANGGQYSPPKALGSGPQTPAPAPVTRTTEPKVLRMEASPVSSSTPPNSGPIKGEDDGVIDAEFTEATPPSKSSPSSKSTEATQEPPPIDPETVRANREEVEAVLEGSVESASQMPTPEEIKGLLDEFIEIAFTNEVLKNDLAAIENILIRAFGKEKPTPIERAFVKFVSKTLPDAILTLMGTKEEKIIRMSFEEKRSMIDARSDDFSFLGHLQGVIKEELNKLSQIPIAKKAIEEEKKRVEKDPIVARIHRELNEIGQREDLNKLADSERAEIMTLLETLKEAIPHAIESQNSPSRKEKLFQGCIATLNEIELRVTPDQVKTRLERLKRSLNLQLINVQHG